jgi:NADP-dependent 3-hydroxy acid dehydrogenase YdfG
MNKLKRKDLKDQVIIITGASNSVGKATVRMAASAGARVVMVSREEAALQELASEVSRTGGDAMYVIADVGQEDDVTRISRSAIRTYGAFDTWINAAGIAVFGNCLDAPMDDMRRFMDTNFWGIVNGSRAAIHHFKETGRPGTVINLNAVPPGRPEALQPLHNIAHEAVRTWLEALRLEIEHERLPVDISLIHPGPDISVRERRLGLRRSGKETFTPQPPEIATAILNCATSPKDDVYVVAESRIAPVLQKKPPQRTATFTSVPENRPAVEDDPFSPAISPRLPDPQTGGASTKRKGMYPGTPRTIFSSIVLAGLGAGMWLLSRPGNRGDHNSPEPKKNG